MSYFGKVMIALLIINLIAKLTWLAKGEAPQRKLSHEAGDVALYVGLLAWGIVVNFC